MRAPAGGDRADGQRAVLRRGRRGDRLQDDAHRHHRAQARAGEAAVPVAGAARSSRRPSTTAPRSPRSRPAAVPVLGDICVIDLVDDAGRSRGWRWRSPTPSSAVRLDPFRTTLAPRRRGDGAGSGDPHPAAAAVPRVFARLARLQRARGSSTSLLIRVSGAQSMMVVPLVVRDRVLGVITLIAAESGRRYSGQLARRSPTELATHAALAIDNARLYERAQPRSARARTCCRSCRTICAIR